MTVRPIDAVELIEGARLLVGSGPGRPRTSNLRRATSGAYYAVFHRISQHGAQWLVPHGDQDQESAVARWFSHTSIDKAARLIVQMVSDPRAGLQSGARKLFPASPQPPLVLVASAFSSLQERRHQADYDHDMDVTKPGTLADIARAEALLDQSRALWEAKDVQYLNFLLLAFAMPVVKSR